MLVWGKKTSGSAQGTVWLCCSPVQLGGVLGSIPGRSVGFLGGLFLCLQQCRGLAATRAAGWRLGVHTWYVGCWLPKYHMGWIKLMPIPSLLLKIMDFLHCHPFLIFYSLIAISVIWISILPFMVIQSQYLFPSLPSLCVHIKVSNANFALACLHEDLRIYIIFAYTRHFLWLHLYNHFIKQHTKIYYIYITSLSSLYGKKKERRANASWLLERCSGLSEIAAFLPAASGARRLRQEGGFERDNNEVGSNSVSVEQRARQPRGRRELRCLMYFFVNSKSSICTHMLVFVCASVRACSCIHA